MNKFLLLIIILFSTLSVSQAQTYNDGCMKMKVQVLRSWNEEYEDPYFNDESSWQWYVEDNGNVDGSGYFGGGCLQQGGFNQIYWWNHADYTIHNFSYGPLSSPNARTVPRYLNLRGKYEGDDSGGSCDQNTGGFFVDDDDYRYNDLVSSFINYRAYGAPNLNNIFQRFTTWHGSSDYGGEFSVNYTSPIPSTGTTNISTICADGSSAAVTLNASGAVFGGSYQWYVGATFDYVGSGSSITVDPIADANGGTSVTYHVYTKNGSLKSECYKDITIDIVNCDFNCTSAQRTVVRTIPSYRDNYNYGSVVTSGYPSGSYITDVNVSTSFTKSNPNNDIGFQLIANASGSSCTSTSLVNEQFTGNGQALTSVLFDEQSSITVSSDPQYVSVMDPTGNLDCYNWSSPNRSWNLRVDHSGNSSFKVSEFEVEVCACKPPTSASITESGTNAITICETQGGTLELNVSGSLGATNGGGFGDEVRWYKDVCYTGAFAGSGNPFTISAPTTPGTYTYYANYYVNGVACENPNITANECKSITITVTEEPVAGAVVQGGDISIDICENTTTGLFTLVGSNFSSTGISIVRWERSTNGGINWTPISNSLTTYNPGVLTTVGTYYYRAVLSNTGCGDTYSDFITVKVLETPSAGTTSMLTTGNTYCSDEIFRISSLGYQGALQWQISSNNGLTYADIPGQSSDDLTYLVNNVTELPVNYLFRMKASNSPCSNSYSTPAEIVTIYPATQGGLLSSSQDICLNGFAADLNLINVHGDSIIWEIDDNNAFTSPTDLGHVEKVIGLNNTLSGSTIGAISTTQYVRARVINDYCTEAFSNIVTLTSYSPPTNTITASQSLCVGDIPAVLVGSSPTGGNGVYSYQWQSSPAGSGSWTNIAGATSKNYNTLAYTVNTDFRRVVVSGPCSSLSTKVTVVYHANPSFTSVSSTDISCFDADDGTISILALNTDSFSIDSGMNYSFSSTFTNLTPGFYNVVIKNTYGCSFAYAANPVEIKEPLEITFTTSVTNPSCSNTSNGSITITATNGVGTLNYALNGGGAQTGNTFSGLSAGLYNIVVSDTKGCIDTGSVTLTEDYTLALNVDSIMNTSCFGQNDGFLHLGTVGGAGPFTFSIDGVNYQTDSVFTGLASGLYTVYTIDNNGCTASSSAIIADSPQMLVSLDSVNSVLCNGDATGAAYISVSGGTGVYTYLWSNSTSNQNLENVSEGSYSVIVSSGGCSSSLNLTINEPTILSASLVSVDDVSCNGGSNGKIDVSVSGGTTPYTYLWSNGDTIEDLYGVLSGTYSLSVTDANNCVSSVVAVVDEFSTLTVVGSGTNSSCANSSDGIASASVSGGQSPYLFSLNGGPLQSGNVFTGLAAASYTITVRDANGCTAIGNALVLNSYSLDLSASSVMNVSCSGQNDGQVQLSTAGGQAPFTFTVNGFSSQTDSLFTGLSGGSYTFEVIDANGCSDTLTRTILENSPMSISLDSVTNVLCAGSATGAAYVSPSGGDGSYSFSWTGPTTSASEDLMNALPGGYDVVVTDGSGCSATLSTTISSPTTLIANVSNVSNVSCNGGADGSIDVVVSGGTPAYTYSWSDGTTVVAITEDLSGVGVGTYVLTITDDNGCIATITQIITENTAIVVSNFEINSSCSNSNDGSIIVTASGGQSPYSYSINGGAIQSSNVFTGLSAGSYSVSIIDAAGCSGFSNSVLSNSYSLSLDTTSVTNVSCAGQNDGEVQLTTTGGQAPFSFTINGALAQADSLFTGLSAGFYTFEVIDNSGCSSSVSTTISESAPMVLSLDSVTNVLCAGDATGAAYISVNGGDGSYTYSWTGAGTSASEDLTNAIAGSYNVSVVDGAGCSATLSVNISSPSVLSVTVSTVNDVSCNGGTDGSVDVSVSGGTPGYTYSWSDITGVVGTTEDLSGFGAGTYTLTVTDDNGCTTNVMATIAEPNTLTVTSAGTNSSCSNSSNGAINVTVSNGVGPYLYSLDGGPIQSSNVFNGLSAGTYNILVTDANGCNVSGSAIILNDYSLTLNTSSVTNVSCAGQNDGEVQLATTGGQAPFSFTINGALAQTSSLFTGLSAGFYTFEVIDNNGCSSSVSTTISENAPMVLSLDSVTNVLCAGDATGAAYISVNGGDGSYTYSWTGAGTSASEDLINAIAGSYNVSVVDGAGCSATLSTSISSPSVLSATVSIVNNVSCNGGTDGSIDVSVSGGTPGYTFSWSDGAGVVGTSEDLSNVGAGTYTLTVTDDNGCTTNVMATVVENSLLTGTISSTDILCLGEEGSASVSVNGGVAPYTYLWSNFDTTSSASGLNEGMISVIVSDKSGCTIHLFDTIQEPVAALEISATIQNVSCFGLNDGSITETVTGGTLPYTITYSPGGTNANLSAGVYTVTVVDGNGCSVSETYTISEPNQIMTTISVTNPNCFGEKTGMAVAGATNGTAPYTYNWNTTPVQSGMIAVGLLGDVDYTVTITDANGCIAYDTAKIENPNEVVLNTIPTSVSCLSSANGSVIVEVEGGNYPYEYQLNGLLQTDSVFDNLSEGNYVVFVTDNANCSSNTSFIITSSSSMQAEIEAAGNDMNFVSEELYVVSGEEVSLNVNFFNDAGNPIVGYNWMPLEIDTIRNPSFMPTNNISVEVEVLEMIDGNICSIFDTIQINVSQESLIFIPTAFSPNNAGQNNFFEMNVLGAENLNVQIFNRWGEEVFSNPTQGNGPNNITDASLSDGTNPRGAWDGKYKGEDVPTGTYAYKVEVTYFDGSTKLIKGSVTIIR